jgi:hypothetical protein
MSRVRVMEKETSRVRPIAKAYGVLKPGVPVRELVAAIEAAYRREIEAEQRRAMHERFVQNAKEAGR